MNTRSLLTAILAVLAPAVNACAQSGPTEEAPWIEPASEQARTLRSIVPADDARPSDEVEARLLAAHNRARAQDNARPLIWSETLEAEARDWAVELIDSGRFAHDPRPHGHGENLWMGWGARAFTPEDMVGDWVKERASYRPGVFPNVSRTGDWIAVGHYTQLIWRDTTHVGCAVESRGDRAVLACRYSPPGNIDGRRP
ncbi:CAP domain-containing protein [Brevundimonas sp.]|uniref:CAP domain-containing protein n=1 Tax=Brevundimonas sp. TaxID=1871086 RepID=UPI00286A64CA|nr:CAP domain-containing protein [Brevundimonas sp.]